MLNSVSDLHGYIERSQLTEDLGGTLEYRHSQWMNHRTVSTNLCALFNGSCFPVTGELKDQLLNGHFRDCLPSGRLGFLSHRLGSNRVGGKAWGASC